VPFALGSPGLGRDYIFGAGVCWMWEFGSFLPGEGFSPDAEGPVLVEGLIEGIVDGLVVDVDSVLDEHPPLAFSLLVLVVPLDLYPPHEDLLEGVEDPGCKHVAFVFLVNLLIEAVHVSEDLNGRGPHGFIQTGVDLFDKVCSSLEEVHEAGKVILDGDGVRLETLLLL
jgi:hypothetical protein